MTSIESDAVSDASLDKIREVVFDAETISGRVQSLGREITDYYGSGELLVLGLLKGSFIFLADLVRNIGRPHQVDFLVASSYGSKTTSSGEVRLVYDPKTQLKGKHILLVEDIVDSGKTINRLVDVLRERDPLSLEVCALLDKGIANHLVIEPRFLGFEAPTKFLVGYGLDHAENHRHLPYIGALQE
ncbi:MAG: hypoxanthine phosphoribosyltransferase [Gemmatimonadetes bacterium]|nr:hypoxanthine phosphoribosyltransferase [Gemmatimonadota bacterium]